MEYDAVVVGAGPNGLAAAIALQQANLSVLVIEGHTMPGGGLRTAELTGPGYWSDVCSAIHPMAAGSPFLQTLPLEQFGLEYIHPPVLAAHPQDDGHAALLLPDLEATAAALGPDGDAYRKLLQPVVECWPAIAPDILGPLPMPRHPLDMAGFGMKALQPATRIARRFKTEAAKGLWAGMAAHSFLPLQTATTAAVGLVLMANGHLRGWPLAKGGSQGIANAMIAYFQSLGGRLETGRYITSLEALPKAKAVLFDISPKQLLEIAGVSLSAFYRWQLKKYRYGPGVFKVDWALHGPVPFTAAGCNNAGTVHLGGTLAEIARSEAAVNAGQLSDNPFVLLAQQSLFDPTRAPQGKQVLWGYCHVPHGDTSNRTAIIEKQIERFAPGFRDLIIDRHTYNTEELHAYNPNYIGGDINGGILDIWQLFTRPALRASPYRAGAKGLYLCSASTPPGGGVHGMCGFHAARRALKDIWHINLPVPRPAG
ncbi:MAG TPA: NAD(P)/FAD-dependent oxidoreductase [Chitinophaga sp.]